MLRNLKDKKLHNKQNVLREFFIKVFAATPYRQWASRRLSCLSVKSRGRMLETQDTANHYN